jgi:hypothetical protein
MKRAIWTTPLIAASGAFVGAVLACYQVTGDWLAPGSAVTGHLGYVASVTGASDSPMDFSTWFEAYLGGRWYTFDARHNKRRIGRILMARGRDATDVAIVTSFGPCMLAGFNVITEEVTSVAATTR